MASVLGTRRPPLRTEPSSGEVFLLVPTPKGLAEVPLQFCPFCGVKLIDVVEDFVLLERPSEEEVAQADALRMTISSRRQAIERLGEPTKIVRPEFAEQFSPDPPIEVLFWDTTFKTIQIYLEVLKSHHTNLRWTQRWRMRKGWEGLAGN